MSEHSKASSPNDSCDSLTNAKSDLSPSTSSKSLGKPHSSDKYDNFFQLDAEDANSEERSAIKRYTYETFNDINQMLREGLDTTPDKNDIFHRDINNIQTYLTSNSFPEAVTLHRGTSAEYLKLLLGDNPIATSAFVQDLQYLSDAELTEKYSDSIFTIDSFISTSVDPDVARDFLPTSNQCILVIAAPEGTQGRFIGNISFYSERKLQVQVAHPVVENRSS